MIYELNKADYPKTLNLFTNLKSNTAIESIYTYKNEARYGSVLAEKLGYTIESEHPIYFVQI
ncbi:MAG: hypothetical protein H6Q59_2777 [Firmicutes bacterium]|nr:hypothetical protein [Bacillota bacterium]